MKIKISFVIILIGMIQLSLKAQANLKRITSGEIANSYQETRGASFIDYNNDNYLDIYVPTGLDIIGMVEIPNILYRNNQNGTFSKISSHETIDLSTASLSGAKWCDVDNNRLLDLLIPDIYINPYRLLIKQEYDSVFETSLTFNINQPSNVRDAGFFDYNIDGYVDIIIVGPDDIFFYSNNGDDTFTETQHDNSSGHGGTSFSYSDFDYDGDLDIFIAEFALGKNRLFYNSNGIFTESDTLIITKDSVMSNSSAWGDYNNDGNMDLFVANNGKNYLYKNLGNSNFEQINSGSIVNDIENSISCNWADIDNDGDLDIFIGNMYGYNNSIYINNGDETFDKVVSGDVVDENSSYTSKGIWGDYDNDGDLDLYVSNMSDDGRNFLYNNTTETLNWIKIRLEGYISNYSSIGAKVKIKANNKWQIRELSVNNSRHCQNDLIAHFGIGAETNIDSILIEWPSGITQYMLDVSSNQLITIQEASFDIDDFICTPDTLIIKALSYLSDSLDWSISGGNFIYNGGDSLIATFATSDSIARISLISNGNIYTEKTIDLIPAPNSGFIIDTNKICGSDPVLVSYTGTSSTSAEYDWNFDGGSVLSGTGEGPYEITWNDSGLKMVSLNITENGCSSDTSINLTVNQQAQPISICMVSVDSSNHNMVVWEQAFDNLNDSIIIYKETSHSDVYEKIGSQSVNNTTVFTDITSDPVQNSKRYKLAVLDTCGYETSQSEYHKTMHLTINSGVNDAWNLIWDGYEGFSYTTYNIYRGTSSDNMIKIVEQASNVFTFTDLTPPVGTVYYQIEVMNPNSCNISNLKLSNNYYGSTHSNIVNSNQVNSIGDLSFEGLEIYPNPAGDKLYLKSIATTNYNIEIFSLDGKLQIKHQNTLVNKEIDISSLKSGLYLIRLSTLEKSINMKFIKR